MRKTSKAPRKKAPAAKSAPAARKRAVAPVKELRSKSKPPAAHGGPRRAVFIDVENTSSEAALLGALDQLGIDRSTIPTEVFAVGNWRVIGQHVARMLARRGARLLHTAPATGVKDWSDLSIAVAAGIWLGRARPTDQIEIISADRAFDAVADAAANLGVKFRRLTYGPTSGLAEPIAAAEPAGGSRRRRRRGGGRSRRRGGESYAAWAAAQSARAVPAAEVEPAPAAAAAPPANGAEKDVLGATHEQIVATIARLTARSPERGVNLDLLINALKAEGFGRPPGSPRLVTRLRKMKDVEVSATGMVRLIGPLATPIDALSEPPPADAPAAADPESSAPAPLAAGARRPRRRGGRGRRRAGGAARDAGESAASEA